MPKRKDDISNSENIKVRITAETRERCQAARLSGAHKRESESSFMSYLIELGITKYEKAILPLERGEDEALHDKADAQGESAGKKERAG